MNVERKSQHVRLKCEEPSNTFFAEPYHPCCLRFCQRQPPVNNVITLAVTLLEPGIPELSVVGNRAPLHHCSGQRCKPLSRRKHPLSCAVISVSPMP